MMEARSYQEKALTAIETAEREGVRRPLVVHPTGTGKTVTFSHAIARRADRGRSLVLVHREELASQARQKLAMIAPELRTGLVKGDQGNDVDAPVVVASVPTVQRDARLAQLLAAHAASPFGTIIADEAHHAPAPGWTKVLTALGSFNPYGPLTIGFTATPERDNKTLGVWEKVVSYMSIREAIFQGFLCPILPACVVETDMDLDRVRKTGGDYSEGDLGRALEESGAIAQMADAVVVNASDRKGIAFLPTVKTSQMLADALRQRGIKAEHLDGTTEKDERAAILLRLKTGETTWVTNCSVLTEGFDEPTISCVLMGRPTKFHGLYVQCIGRGTRKAPGKDNLLIIDVTGVTKRHELIGAVDLGLDMDEKAKKREPGEQEACRMCGVPCEFPEHRCALCHRYLPQTALYDGVTRHENCHAGKAGPVDVFGSSKLRWLPVETGWCLGAGQEVVVMVPAGVDTWKLAAYKGGKLEVLHEEIPADWAMGIGEDRSKAFTKLVERDARWLRNRPTEAQLGRLVREGFPAAKLARVKTRGDAADLITRIGGRRAARRLLGAR